MKPPVGLRDAEVEQDRIVHPGHLDPALRALVATRRRASGAAEHEQATVVAHAELGLTGPGDERLDVGHPSGRGRAHERVGDGLAGSPELAVVVLEPGDDDVGGAHAASGSAGTSPCSAAQRSTATSACATT